MVSGPFLFPFHYSSIGSFGAEWLAFAFGLGAFAVGLSSRVGNLGGTTLVLPRLVLAPTAIIVIVAIQLAMKRIPFPPIGLIVGAYMLWAGLLMILGGHLASTIGRPRLALVLSTAIAAGAGLSSIVALLQWTGLSQQFDWIFSSRGAIGANIGLSNQFALYSWLGIASLTYLRNSRALGAVPFWLAVVLITFSSALSSSRSIFLYPLVLILASWDGWPIGEDRSAPRRSREILLLLPILFACNFAASTLAAKVAEYRLSLTPLLTTSTQQPPIREPYVAVPSSSRVVELVDVATPRPKILKTGVLATLQSPLLGVGAGNFAWASFELAGTRTDKELYVSDHAHNLILDISTEYGIPVALLVVILLVRWSLQFFRQQRSSEKVWFASCLGLLFLNSMFGYPFWYAYFLGPTALLLGATDRGVSTKISKRNVSIYAIAIALAGAWILARLNKDYGQLIVANQAPLIGERNRQTAWVASTNRLIQLGNESLIGPWASRVLLIFAEPSIHAAENRANFCLYAVKLTAERKLITQCVLHLAIAGDRHKAQELLDKVLRAFPDEAEITTRELQEISDIFPEIAELQLESDKTRQETNNQ